MSAVPLIAHGGPQRLPTRAASSLVGHYATRAGPLHGLRGRSAIALTGPTILMQPMLMSAVRRAATITPGLAVRETA